MKRYENGMFVEMTTKELAEYEKARIKENIPYEQRVVNRIREVYSLDDELALLRQRVLKADEFQEYFNFVEKIKEEERNV